MQYRKEIDGLRAIAVLPVILFHAGFEIFSGGFVGVDVFFVLSGYLITSIILIEKESNKFTIQKFYERRIRRIMPALFVVLFSCLPFAWLWMFPGQQKEFSQSLIAAILFYSNIFFWRESGYFETASEEKPLLHTWTLSVEEQFYVIFPVFIAVFWRIGKQNLSYMIALGTVLSFALAEYASRYYIEEGFYLIPTRAWELLIGSLCAFYLRGREPTHNSIGSFMGLAMIVAAIFLIDKTMRWPSAYTLLPVLGTALLILFTTSQSFVYRILTIPVFVHIGLISYSAYLWHQPLFAFARIRSIEHPPMWLMLLLAIVTLVLAHLSLKYVEQPFRKKGAMVLADRKKLFGVTAFLACLFVGLGLYSSNNTHIDLTKEDTSGICNFDKNNCYELPAAKMKVAIWGDSYADAFSISLGDRLNANDISMYAFIKHGCPSILGTIRNEDARLGKSAKKECLAHNEKSMREIQKLNPDYIILTSSYRSYLKNKNINGDPVLLDIDDPQKNPVDFLPMRLGQMMKALEKNGAKIILVTTHPGVKDFNQERKKIRFGEGTTIYADPSEATSIRDLIVTGLQKTGADFIEEKGLDWFCKEDQKCPVVDEQGNYLLYDGSHISSYMAKRVSENIRGIISLNN